MDPSPDEIAIRRVLEDSLEASNRGDLEGYGRHLADDITYFMTGLPPTRGRDNFMAAYRALAAQCHIQASLDIEEIKVMGDYASCVTRLTVVLTPHGGSPRRRSGHTLGILRREPDNRWVIFRDANLIPEL
jgi:uncharacterized protein (TIGR02246 family)